MAISGMSDELERYKQLLNDWNIRKPSPGPPRSAPETPPNREAEPEPEPNRPAGQRAKLIRPVVEEAEDGRYPKGSILCLDDEELVIYRRPVAGKSYDMVYSLLADGSVKIEGVELDKHQVAELGQLSPAHQKKLQTEMRWNRDLVAYNCYRLEDSERIPEPNSGTMPGTGYAKPPGETKPEPKPEPKAATREAQAPPKPAQPPRPESQPLRRPAAEAEAGHGKQRIRRGQRVTVKFGDRMWDAVYWGMDQKGTVVAHCTHGRWSLMHLDLNRFKETLVVAPEADPLLVTAIMRDLETKSH